MASKNLSPTGKHAYPLDRIGTHLEIGDTECNNQEQGSTDADGHSATRPRRVQNEIAQFSAAIFVQDRMPENSLFWILSTDKCLYRT